MLSRGTMQENQPMKKTLTALILATLAASPAFAATKHSHMSTTPTANQSYAAEIENSNNVENGNNVYANPRDPDVVISDDVYAGRDPDPNVRAQLMRDPGLPAN
jgi:hypothetical protein